MSNSRDLNENLHPLYDYLAVIPKSDILPLSDVVGTISNLHKEVAEIVLSLIIHHHNLYSKQTRFGSVVKIPYKGELMSKNGGISFEVKNLDSELQSIIAAYIMMITGS